MVESSQQIRTEVTVNTDIMMCGSGKGDGCFPSAITFLRNLNDDQDLGLSLDARRKIEQEYLDKMTASDLGMIVLKTVLEQGRFTRHDWRSDRDGWKPIRLKLQGCSHREDHSFVRTAIESESRIIVADEKDFRLFRKIGG